MSAHEQVRTAAKLVRESLLTLQRANAIVAGVAAAEGDERPPIEVLDATYKLRRIAIDLQAEANDLFAGANKMRAAAERAR